MYPLRRAVLGQPLPADYTVFLQRGSLKGKRIGVDYRYFTPDYGGDPATNAVVNSALNAMTALGATVVNTDSGDLFEWIDDMVTVLLYEFKVQIAEYLAGLRPYPAADAGGSYRFQPGALQGGDAVFRAGGL